MTSFLNNYAVSILAIAALTVLTALNKVSANVSVPLIVAIVGVHTGANLSNNNNPPATVTAAPQLPVLPPGA